MAVDITIDVKFAKLKIDLINWILGIVLAVSTVQTIIILSALKFLH